jgi:hypothetical protein
MCQCIGQPKGDDKVLIETISHREGRLGYILSTNLNLVIARAEINLGEYLGSH